MKLYTMMRAGAAVLKGRLTGRPKPIFATLATNSDCQSHCRYCKIPSLKTPRLSTEQTIAIIDQLADFGIQRLGVWGGEPLLRPDLKEILSRAKERSMYVTLDTNGYLIPRRTDLLETIDHLIISLDGPEEAHDANREPGSFAKAWEAVETVSRAGTPLWTITVLTANNLDKVDWILDRAEAKNFTPTFQVLHHSDYYGVNDPLRPSEEACRECLKKLIEAKKQGRRIGNSLQCLEHLLAWPDYKLNASPQPGSGWNQCWAGKFFVNIDADGCLYPCSLLINENKGPNILELGFEGAWRKLISSPLPCHSCSATCFTEYNLLFSLNHRTILQWVLAMKGRLTK